VTLQSLARAPAWGFLAAFALALGAPPRAEAQDQAASDSAPLEVSGRVIDALTGSAVHGAFVGVLGEGWGVLSERDGRFHLPLETTRPVRIVVENLGYETLETEVNPRSAGPHVLRLEPNPFQIGELRVLVDRFESRRKAAPMSVTTYERDALLVDPSVDVMQFLQGRTGRPLKECPFRSSFGSLCAMRRGRWQPVQIYIDEMPVFGGIQELRTYNPQELYMVEVYNLGQQIRLYSTSFMDRIVRSGRRLNPIPIS